MLQAQQWNCWIRGTEIWRLSVHFVKLHPQRIKPIDTPWMEMPIILNSHQHCISTTNISANRYNYWMSEIKYTGHSTLPHSPPATLKKIIVGPQFHGTYRYFIKTFNTIPPEEPLRNAQCNDGETFWGHRTLIIWKGHAPSSPHKKTCTHGIFFHRFPNISGVSETHGTDVWPIPTCPILSARRQEARKVCFG